MEPRDSGHRRLKIPTKAGFVAKGMFATVRRADREKRALPARSRLV